MMNIGVLLAIPEPYGGELQARRAAYGDPQAAAVPIHVTLLPPSAVDTCVLPEVERHLAAVAAEASPFQLRLSGTGTFRPVSQVVFVQVEQGSLECVELQASVRSGVLHRELQFPYHPHVTVAHDLDAVILDAARTDLADYQAEFTVPGFGLYAQDRSGAWSRLRSFPFPDQMRAAA